MNANGVVLRYLVYADDGAAIVYSGVDDAVYRDVREGLDREYGGALVGQCMAGRERWVIVAYFRNEPPADQIKRRREGGLLGLAWEQSGAAP